MRLRLTACCWIFGTLGLTCFTSGQTSTPELPASIPATAPTVVPTTGSAPSPTTMPVATRAVPAPLFDDPVWHGAADPTLIWNEQQKTWYMYYTQRRATLNPAHGVDWCHGTAIGIATSPDGVRWTYKGICEGDQGLSKPIENKCTWWAPSVFYTDGVYHMFVVYVDGIYVNWGGKAFIKHFTSRDGSSWAYQDTLKLSSDRCIDACVDRVGGRYRCWYKDEKPGGHTWMASSDDLKSWSVDGEMVGDVGHEAPLYFHWKNGHWLIVDAGGSLRVYKSDDGLGNWKFNASVLVAPGHREKDNGNGKHPFVMIQGDHASIYYFVHYGPRDPIYDARRTVIQMAELKLEGSGIVVCDRDKPE